MYYTSSLTAYQTPSVLPCCIQTKLASYSHGHHWLLSHSHLHIDLHWIRNFDPENDYTPAWTTSLMSKHKTMKQWSQEYLDSLEIISLVVPMWNNCIILFSPYRSLFRIYTVFWCQAFLWRSHFVTSGNTWQPIMLIFGSSHFTMTLLDPPWYRQWFITRLPFV